MHSLATIVVKPSRVIKTKQMRLPSTKFNNTSHYMDRQTIIHHWSVYYPPLICILPTTDLYTTCVFYPTSVLYQSILMIQVANTSTGSIESDAPRVLINN